MSDVIRALGAMSGTSLDGVDAAVVETDGVEIARFGPSAYRPFQAVEQETLRAALGGWPGDVGVADAARVVEEAHADLLGGFHDIDLAGFHGQTLAHDPGGRGTHQAGDGAALAERLGLPVVWDFRSEDVAQGGQGAPLAPFFHWACARWAGLTAPVAFVNLGGVGNLTWCDPRVARPEEACLAFDTGPANAPLNDLMWARRGVTQDAGGALALSGRVDDGIVRSALQRGFFAEAGPKSLDRDDFADLGDLVAALSDADAAATLVAVATGAVARGLRTCPTPPERLLVTGGGRHNRAMMEGLARDCPVPVAPVEEVGLDGDMLEAQAFAWLAVRVARGLPISGPNTTGVPAPCVGGRLSRPAQA